MNGKFLFIGLFLLAFCLSTSALVLQEKTANEVSFEGLSLVYAPGAANENCSIFPMPALDTSTPATDTVVSLPVSFALQEDSDSNVTVFANTVFVHVIRAKEVSNLGFARVILPNDLAEGNPIRICVSPGKPGQMVSVSAEGMKIGTYLEPRFDNEGDFVTLLATNNPVLGQEIPIEVHIRNSGGEAVVAHVNFRKYDLSYIPLLKGTTEFDGEIAPNETKVIRFTIKPLKPTQLLLPPAILTYTNVFGETVTLPSTRAYVDVHVPAFNVTGIFLADRTQGIVNQPLTVRWLAKNEGLNPLYGLMVLFTPSDGGRVSPSSLVIAQLLPQKAESRDLTVVFSEPGTYTIECEIHPPGDTTLRAGCAPMTLEVVEDRTGLAIVLSLLVVLVAVGVYAYIYYYRDRPKVAPVTIKRRFQP